MNRFEFIDLPLSGLKLVENLLIKDDRGFFSRIFCYEEFLKAGWIKPIKQINHTLTEKSGTIRGLHFQNPPYTEMKLVKCLKGKIWDIVVDIRSGSDTFLQWHAEQLTEENHRSLLIPEGFAHGFQSLTNNVEILYLHTELYQPGAEGRINPADPILNINWPAETSYMSEQDSCAKMLDVNFRGIKL